MSVQSGGQGRGHCQLRSGRHIIPVHLTMRIVPRETFEHLEVAAVMRHDLDCVAQFGAKRARTRAG